MKNQKQLLATTVLLGVAGLSFIAGCKLPFGDSGSKSEVTSNLPAVDKSDVLLSIDGKPVLTVQEYEEQLEMARGANQQVDMLLNMMPNAEKEFVFKGIATGKLMKAWAEKEGLDKTAEFQKQRKQLHEAMDLQLYMKAFDEAHPIKISNADVEKFYQEKKDSIPGLMTSPGGVQTAYVRFDTKDKAEKFLDKAKEAKDLAEFKSDAEKEKLTVAEATINQKSSFGDAIKNSAMDIKKFPAARVVKAGENAYWVLYATGKSDAQYRDVKSPEVQQGLKKMLTDEKKEKQLEGLVEKLKKDLNVSENHDYFDKKEATKRAAMEAVAQQQQASQSGDESAQKVNNTKARKHAEKV